MSIENKKTLEVYNKKASTYIATGILHDNKDLQRAEEKRKDLQMFIKNTFAKLDNGSKVFEIGSADGANAKYIQELGYHITASDVAEDFIKATRFKGINTIKFNVLEDKLQEQYNGVFCWRVFVHFTKEDVKIALKNVYEALEKNGIFIFNVMNREVRTVDEEWVDFSNEYHMGAERYYRYFKEQDINEIATEIGYKIETLKKEGGENNNKWLVYVLKK